MKRIYLFRFEAIPKKNISEKIVEGSPFSVLIFIHEASLEEAEDKAYSELSDEWDHISLEEKAAFDPGTLDDAEKYVMQAYQKALKHGVAKLIFTE